jgi:membrane dipeptidase
MVEMRLIALLGLLAFIMGCSEKDNEKRESAAAEMGLPEAVLTSEQQDLTKQLLLIDTHIDLPMRLNRNYEDISVETKTGDFDYTRASNGGLDVAFMSIYIPASIDEEGGAKDLAEQLISTVEAIVANAPDKFSMAHSTSQVLKNRQAEKMSLAMGMENGAPIEGDLANVGYFHDKGIRYITLAHSRSNHISDSSYDENHQWNGLSDFGKKLIGEMNRVGIMVDVSHITDEAFYQVMEISDVPVIASHSSARHFTPGFERNMDDAMIMSLAEHGGVIQITFGSGFVNEKSRVNGEARRDAIKQYLEKHQIDMESEEAKAFTEKFISEWDYVYASLDDVLDHFDHVRNLVGTDHLGIGSDFEGVGDSLPTGLKDASQYPNLINGLVARGYTAQDIGKIMGGNLMRVWKAVEARAASR